MGLKPSYYDVFSVRVANTLFRNNIAEWQLRLLSDHQLLQLRGVGKRALAEIRQHYPSASGESDSREEHLLAVISELSATLQAVREQSAKASQAKMSDREWAILQARLQGKTLDRIGREHGVTRERVRAILAKLRRKLWLHCLRRDPSGCDRNC